jgi:predicted AAA+ superfamily ATPase
VLRVAQALPVVTVTGPRQSGKTTLCQAAFPVHPCVNLEIPGDRQFALEDPRAFLARLPDGTVLD